MEILSTGERLDWARNLGALLKGPAQKKSCLEFLTLGSRGRRVAYSIKEPYMENLVSVFI